MPLAVRTPPRELPPRYVKTGDEIAMHEMNANGNDRVGDRWTFARSAAYVAATPADLVWFSVVDGPHAIRPPASKDEGRVEGIVRHGAGRWWKVDDVPRPAPDDVDHVGHHRLMLVTDAARHTVVYLSDAETIVVREVVQVREGQPIRAGITRDAGTRRVLALVQGEERGSAGEDTRRLPSRRIPLGVYGASLGHIVKDAEDEQWVFESERGI